MSHWQSLSVFLAVAEEGSLSGAAKRLDLTQPTVSFHIDNLEKKLGCPLVERASRGTSLTVYGEVLYANTRKAEAMLKSTENQLKAMTSGASGRIILGASTIPAEYILPGLIAAHLRTNPAIEVSLKTGDSQTVLDAFYRGELSIAVVGSRPPGECEAHPLWQDELVLVAHPEMAARLGESPSPEDVLALPLVARGESSGSMRAVFDAFSAHGIGQDRLHIAFQVGGNEALKAAIASQAGVGFVSRWAVADGLASGRLAVIPLPAMKIVRRFYAVSRPPLVPACVKAFWEYLIASGASL
ncbi:LysR substrate-binding domain-containing protein [Anaeroselena agilis]|uniref:LysR family transcriptional regulator n=1 Tax=Anaeroselena agilis TaxID=3063788 RepID=A0ABU3NTS5_9FIRM|nr:LysR family transcriptional regulator [Selenomonadales bacterium 4137-cl]